MALRDRVHSVLARRTFSARETAWQQQLDGLELASFKRRAGAFLLDWTIAGLLTLSLLAIPFLGYYEWRHLHYGEPFMAGHLHLSTQKQDLGGAPVKIQIHPEQSGRGTQGADDEPAAERAADAEASSFENVNHVLELALPILYFGLLTWWGKGRTPGKRVFGIRVVSLVHRHLSLWHSIERALGYGAAALEGGFGFAQYFIHPYRRCVQDRIAETIVVTERSYRSMRHRFEIAHADPLGDPTEQVDNVTETTAQSVSMISST